MSCPMCIADDLRTVFLGSCIEIGCLRDVWKAKGHMGLKISTIRMADDKETSTRTK